MSVTVCAVLRSGGEYRHHHVEALAAGVAEHLPGADFVCLTDMRPERTIFAQMRHGWPGWWSKLELFRPGLFAGRILYLDLDTVITGDLSEIAAYVGPFAMLSDFLRPERPASGVMAWQADCEPARRVWDAFIQAPDYAMQTSGGDQAFIRSVLGDDVDRLQDLVPGQIASYKVHVRDTGRVPSGTRLVCFHGKPRPWDAEWTL